MQIFLRGVRTMRVHRGCKIIADNVIVVLGALTQNKGKRCHVKQDPYLTPYKSIKILGREKQNLLVLFCFLLFL